MKDAKLESPFYLPPGRGAFQSPLLKPHYRRLIKKTLDEGKPLFSLGDLSLQSPNPCEKLVKLTNTSIKKFTSLWRQPDEETKKPENSGDQNIKFQRK